MEYKRFGNTIVARFEIQEEVIACIHKIAEKENIMLATIQAIGASDHYTLGAYNTNTHVYEKETVLRPSEITSLMGNITRKDGQVYIHVHMNTVDENGKCYGGHLNEAFISATCEMFIQVIDGNVKRRFDEGIGLNLFDFE